MVVVDYGGASIPDTVGRNEAAIGYGMTGGRIVLARRPVGHPVAADFRFETFATPRPADGQILLATEWLSLDPYMRGRMSDEPSYAPPIAVGDVIVGRTISRVTESRHKDFAVGDLVMANSGWQTLALSDGSDVRRLPADMARPTLALGVLGNSGFAAYIGLLEVARLAPGETVIVAAATGPVGATVVQLAKLKGARVIAIAGGETKLAYAREVLGADVALDHRTPELPARLAAALPDGAEVYFENVGGAVLAAVMPVLKPRARIAVCGLIAWYNLAGAPPGPDQAPGLMRALLRKRVRVEGFVVTDWLDRQDDFRRDMEDWVAHGQITYLEEEIEGLENAPAAFIGMLEGRSFGKLLVRVAR